jgi:hypothetical protein
LITCRASARPPVTRNPGDVVARSRSRCITPRGLRGMCGTKVRGTVGKILKASATRTRLLWGTDKGTNELAALARCSLSDRGPGLPRPVSLSRHAR